MHSNTSVYKRLLSGTYLLALPTYFYIMKVSFRFCLFVYLHLVVLGWLDFSLTGCGQLGSHLSVFQVLTYIDGKSKVEEMYLKHRVGFLYPMPSSNISIAINNTQEDDSGQYMCTVNLGDENSVDGRNIGLLNLTVLGKWNGCMTLGWAPRASPTSVIMDS